MKFDFFISRNAIKSLSRFHGGRSLSPCAPVHANASAPIAIVASFSTPSSHGRESIPRNPTLSKPTWISSRSFHSDQKPAVAEQSDPEEDGEMTEFLSRFVWIMRGKITQAYENCDKQTIDGMLLLIVGKVISEMESGRVEEMLGSASQTAPSSDFSEDLWRTVWEVSNKVLDDMKTARKKEKMKTFLQAEEVKEKYRFACEIGVRGDMLRELRFKWAREKMEESEFYENLERIREETRALEKEKEEGKEAAGDEIKLIGSGSAEDGPDVAVEEAGVVSLPKRHGKIKYKIYGLNLSDPKWVEVADRVQETGEILWPQELKPIMGKCKLVTERILSLKEEDDPSPLLAEWVELLQPSRIDWMNLLDRLKAQSSSLYLKVAELVLSQQSFQTNIRDYSKLIDAHAQENRLEDAERILKKMYVNGISPDILTSTVLVHMYNKVGNLDRAKEAFDNMRSQGFRPDVKVYASMIMAYVTANQPMLGEQLMRAMEKADIKPTKGIYIALLRSFSQRGDVEGAHRISTSMQFARVQQDVETFALLIQAYGKAGNPNQARANFDHMRGSGLLPDDSCIANMIAAYMEKNMLDKALNLLLELEKKGIKLGVSTYTVLLKWFSKLQLVDEAEQMLGKISQQCKDLPLEVHISLCDMYSRSGAEKKSLQALGILEAKKEQLGPHDFERIISGLITGGFFQDATRIEGLMKAQGFPLSEKIRLQMMTSKNFHRNRQTTR